MKQAALGLCAGDGPVESATVLDDAVDDIYLRRPWHSVPVWTELLCDDELALLLRHPRCPTLPAFGVIHI